MQKRISLIVILGIVFLLTFFPTVTYGENSHRTNVAEHNSTSTPQGMKYMRKCNITIEGNGYSCWLSGIDINNKTFISLAIVHLLEGETQIYSIENPDENYTSNGEQVVFVRWYRGYYYSNQDSIPPYVLYNGTAMSALIIDI
ncbi:MAG: hypothetical protein DRN12_04855 [Thermoplasmata archaeon]|nr:MAG: hypothetical protein DRN12_04855 [Thermoplasmata archaeon]HEC89252.1 hypothetical protein [Thermoplasmatales archaeon]